MDSLQQGLKENEPKALEELSWLNSWTNIFHDFNPESSKLFRYCVQQNDYDCIDKLLQKVSGKSIDNTILQLACYLGREKIVERLLQDGRFDPNYSFGYPSSLQISINQGFTNIVRLLLQQPKVDVQTISIDEALNKNFVGIVQALVEDNRYQFSTNDLINVFQNNRTQILRILLQSIRVQVLLSKFDYFPMQTSTESRLLTVPYLNPSFALQQLIYTNFPDVPRTKIVLYELLYRFTNINDAVLILKNAPDDAHLYTVKLQIFKYLLEHQYHFFQLDPNLIAYSLLSQFKAEELEENVWELLLESPKLLFTERIYKWIIFEEHLDMPKILTLALNNPHSNLFEIANLIIRKKEDIFYNTMEKNDRAQQKFYSLYNQRHKIIKSFFDIINDPAEHKYLAQSTESVKSLIIIDIFVNRIYFRQNNQYLQINDSSVAILSKYIQNMSFTNSALYIIRELTGNFITSDVLQIHYNLPSIIQLADLLNYIRSLKPTIEAQFQCSYDRRREDTQSKVSQTFNKYNIYWPKQGYFTLQKDFEGPTDNINLFVFKNFLGGNVLNYRRMSISRDLIENIRKYRSTNQIIYLDIGVPKHVYGCLIYMNTQTIITLDTTTVNSPYNIERLLKGNYNDEFKYLFQLIFDQESNILTENQSNISSSQTMMNAIVQLPKNIISIQDYDYNYFGFGQCLDWNILIGFSFVKEFPSMNMTMDEFLEQAVQFYVNFEKKYTLKNSANFKNYVRLQTELGLINLPEAQFKGGNSTPVSAIFQGTHFHFIH